MQSGAGPMARKMYVGHVPDGCTEDVIRETFGCFGEIEMVKMEKGPIGESKDFCFVTFRDQLAAEAVFKNYDNNNVQGKWVSCKPATAKQTPGFKGCKGGFGKGGFKGGFGPCDAMAINMMSMMAAMKGKAMGMMKGGKGKGFGKGKDPMKGKMMAAMKGKAMASMVSEMMMGGGMGWDGGWGGKPMMSEKDHLIAELKELQRNDVNRTKWEQFCESSGSKFFDPKRYDENFLRGALETMRGPAAEIRRPCKGGFEGKGCGGGDDMAIDWQGGGGDWSSDGCGGGGEWGGGCGSGGGDLGSGGLGEWPGKGGVWTGGDDLGGGLGEWPGKGGEGGGNRSSPY